MSNENIANVITREWEFSYDENFEKIEWKVIASDKEITKIVVDPDEETADIDTSNNTWPKTKKVGEFDSFKENVKGQ